MCLMASALVRIAHGLAWATAEVEPSSMNPVVKAITRDVVAIIASSWRCAVVRDSNAPKPLEAPQVTRNGCRAVRGSVPLPGVSIEQPFRGGRQCDCNHGLQWR